MVQAILVLPTRSKFAQIEYEILELTPDRSGASCHFFIAQPEGPLLQVDCRNALLTGAPKCRRMDELI